MRTSISQGNLKEKEKLVNTERIASPMNVDKEEELDKLHIDTQLQTIIPDKDKKNSTRSKASLGESSAIKKSGGAKLDARIEKIEKYLTDRFDWLKLNQKKKQT